RPDIASRDRVVQLLLDYRRELSVDFRQPLVELPPCPQRLDHEKPRQGLVGREGPEKGQKRGVGFPYRRLFRLNRFLDLRSQPGRAAVQELEEDRLLSGKVKVNAALRSLRLDGYVVDRGLAI